MKAAWGPVQRSGWGGHGRHWGRRGCSCSQVETHDLLSRGRLRFTLLAAPGHLQQRQPACVASASTAQQAAAWWQQAQPSKRLRGVSKHSPASGAWRQQTQPSKRCVAAASTAQQAAASTAPQAACVAAASTAPNRGGHRGIRVTRPHKSTQTHTHPHIHALYNASITSLHNPHAILQGPAPALTPGYACRCTPPDSRNLCAYTRVGPTPKSVMTCTGHTITRLGIR